MNNRILMIGCAVAFGVLCPWDVMAQQTVTGTVRDADGNPMPGVKVTPAGEPGDSRVTGEDGTFTIVVDEDGYIELNYAEDFERSATSTARFSNSFFGMIPGLHTQQNVGWDEGASRYVRGAGMPLILINGFERDITYLALEEIESVQLLKDGPATALYGMRAADGVMLITTKRGAYNTFDVDVNYRHGFEMPVNMPEMVDAYTYAKLQNEALYYDGLPLQYTREQVESFRTGSNPLYYPDVDWMKEAVKDFSNSNQFNVMLRGGGKRVRYMTFVDYQNRAGLLRSKYTAYSDRYNSQIRDYDLNLRMGLDVDITKSTFLKFNIYGNIGESKRPYSDINGIFMNLYKVPAAAFPIKTANNVWGSNTMFKMNPLAEIADAGYVQTNRRRLEADLRLIQDLSMLTKGLKAEVAVAYDNVASFAEIGSKAYMYEISYISDAGMPVSTFEGKDEPLAITSSKLSSQYLRISVEGKVNYARSFKDHHLDVSAIYRQDMNEALGANGNRYRMSIMGVAGYNYAGRYMVDVVANYFGSCVMLPGDKFRLYPAVGLGWNIANEPFMKSASWVDMLKIRASWGQSANDASISPGSGNYYFVSGGGYAFGDNNTEAGGLKEGNMPVTRLDVETSTKYNAGIDLRLWKGLTFTAEYFHDHRTDILITDNTVSGMLGTNVPRINRGEYKISGVELSAGWEQRRKDFSYYINANVNLNGTELIEDGQEYQPYDYLYRKGHRIDQLFGLEAIGYFRDDEDIKSSPVQTFSTVRPGDIKYKDQNGDRKIDKYDFVPIGKSTTTPEIYYGLNLGFEYKGLGLDLTFDGVGGITKVLNVSNVHRPLRNGNTNIATWYLKDRVRWTESTKDTANLPRLSTLDNSNNYQTSTQWIEDGSFFKLRNVRLHYSLPKKWAEKMRMDRFQIYVKAVNVFSIDKIDYFNCEDLSLGYPDLFSVYVGLNINF